ncbi:MAG: guanylate kinase [Lachnospiraceae bacterium]|nr:guanylate kinase [Lachnospiraceae bacterium]
MGKIFYVMGKSSSGKDTIYKRVMRDKSLGLSKIVPYTTRPIREGEKEGVQYHFTDKAGFDKLFKAGKVIEHRTYDTFYGEWKYFTVDDGDIDLNKNNYLIIGTPESYMATKKYFGESNVLPILINVDDGVRLQRALNRERKQETPKYEEMCRRFLADTEDFGEEKLKECKIEKRFENEDLDKCLEQVIGYIKRNMTDH